MAKDTETDETDLGEDSRTQGREGSTPKGLGWTANKKKRKQNRIEDHSFGFNNLPYPALGNRTFANSTVVPVKLQGYLETNHSVYKEKRIEYFKCRHGALFKSPKLLVIALQTRNVTATDLRVS